MTDQQWELLLEVIDGRTPPVLPVAFLVDGPWVSSRYGVTLLDYYGDDRLWLEANLDLVQRFPEVLFLAGFWAEYGMISNPPAFGCKCIWPEEGFPTCEPVLSGCQQVQRLRKPNAAVDGLLPLLVGRLRRNRQAIERAGHRIRFATSHGPLTIASYLVGHTEFFLGMKSDPKATGRLLDLVTEFVCDWLLLQCREFASIDGVLVLEDLMGFVGPDDFVRFVLARMKRIFAVADVRVKFLHNDAYGLVTARYLDAMGVNLFNFSFEHSLDEVRRLAGPNVTLMGNIAPRDVLALGSCRQVEQAVRDVFGPLPDRRRVLASAGGFLPPGVSDEKIDRFLAAVQQCD